MTSSKILVVEDEKDLRTVLLDQLELDGFEVIGAETGKDALEIFENFRPDVVILDLNLPDVDGLIVCQHIRKKSEVPVIIVSAREALSDKIRGLDFGADDYLTKPFDYLELAARVRACLRRKSVVDELSPDVLEFDLLKIIPESRKVELDGKAIKLTKKEFDLLMLLATNSEKVLKRDFICAQLWPQKEIYPWSRTLDVHIRRLRKKIEPNPEVPRFIITHPGVGYLFQS